MFEFSPDRFAEFRDQLLTQYPTRIEHTRVEVDLINPSDTLPSEHTYFYHSDNWSTIFDVYPIGETVRCFLEEGHRNPWGEPVTLVSTREDIGNQISRRFAHFRGKFWELSSYYQYGVRLDFLDFANRGWSIIDIVAIEEACRLLLGTPIEKSVDWAKEGF